MLFTEDETARAAYELAEATGFDYLTALALVQAASRS